MAAFGQPLSVRGQQLLDSAVSSVMADEKMRIVFHRYGLTPAMREQILLRWRTLELESRSGGP